MRILVHGTQPEVHFHLTPYDMGTNYHQIQDFLFLMKWPHDHSLRNELLAHNSISNVLLENPQPPFSVNTVLKLLFSSRDTMFAYLKNEVPPEKVSALASLNQKLKEFFDARDREIASNQPPDYSIN
jgi:hypothetical protein